MIEDYLSNFGTPEDVDYIVVSDGEEVSAFQKLGILNTKYLNRSWASEIKASAPFLSLSPN